VFYVDLQSFKKILEAVIFKTVEYQKPECGFIILSTLEFDYLPTQFCKQEDTCFSLSNQYALPVTRVK